MNLLKCAAVILVFISTSNAFAKQAPTKLQCEEMFANGGSGGPECAKYKKHAQ